MVSYGKTEGENLEFSSSIIFFYNFYPHTHISYLVKVSKIVFFEVSLRKSINLFDIQSIKSIYFGIGSLTALVYVFV